MSLRLESDRVLVSLLDDIPIDSSLEDGEFSDAVNNIEGERWVIDRFRGRGIRSGSGEESFENGSHVFRIGVEELLRSIAR